MFYCSGSRHTSSTPNAFEPMPPGEPFGDMMNGPAWYVVSKTLEGAGAAARSHLRTLEAAPGKTILTDGSHQLVHTLLEHDLVDGLRGPLRTPASLSV